MNREIVWVVKRYIFIITNALEILPIMEDTYEGNSGLREAGVLSQAQSSPFGMNFIFLCF